MNEPKTLDRNALQEQSAELWLSKGCHGTLILGTGFGKTRTSILVIEKLLERGDLNEKSKVVILVNTETLRDKEWPAELKKWGCKIKPVIACYQSTTTWEGKDIDLLIADEFDFSLTPEYAKVYFSNNIDRFLGLTGFIEEKKKEAALKVAPILTELLVQDAQQMGILNKTRLIVCKYFLSNENTIPVKFKDKKTGEEKTFYTSEAKQYMYRHEAVIKASRELAGMAHDHPAREKVRNKLSYEARERAKILHYSDTSARKTKNLIERILKKKSESKVLCFSQYVKQSKKICSETFHGGDDEVQLDKLSRGEIRVLGAGKRVTRGVNLVGVDNIIMETYNSSQQDCIQKHGRGVRLPPDKTMNFILIVPYYMHTVTRHDGVTVSVPKPTKAVDWAQNMLGEFKPSEVIEMNL